jgi:transcriptional regulator with XRE-family HTH domain
MPTLTELGAQVKQARRSLKLTRDELAKRAGVSRARIEVLENLRAADIGFKNLLRILNAVGLDLRVTTFNQQRPTLEDLQAEEAEGKTA